MLEFPHFLESMNISIGPRKVAELCFLNYKPKSKNLKHQPLNFGEEIKQIEEHFSDVARKASNEIFNNETELMNIIPKKSNIDLKRNLSKKLEKLAKKTDLAILEMISILKNKKKNNKFLNVVYFFFGRGLSIEKNLMNNKRISIEIIII